MDENKGASLIGLLDEGRGIVGELVSELELLRRENKELRTQVANGSGAPAAAGSAAAPQPTEAAADSADTLDHRRVRSDFSKAKARLQQLERENRDFADQFVALEHTNGALMNLYVASFQLHASVEFAEVIRVIVEIVINFVGAERFGIYLAGESDENLTLVAHEALDDPGYEMLPLTGVIAEAMDAQSAFIAQPHDEITQALPMACIPLHMQGVNLGAILIYSLFDQKRGFQEIDIELFDLLAGQAATALYSARLFEASQRKLHTLQGFLDLLKSSPDAAHGG